MSLSSFDAVDIIVGTNGGGLTFDDFTFGGYTRFFEISGSDTEFYDDGWKLGSFGTLNATGLMVGTLTMTARQEGIYELIIDSSVDGGRSSVAGGGQAEQLSGRAIVWVGVPEPGTLSLLGLAALGLIRRRECAPRPATAPSMTGASG